MKPQKNARQLQSNLILARGITGKEALPFEVHLRSENKLLRWEVSAVNDSESKALKSLLNDGLSLRGCAEKMGMSKSSIHRLKNKSACHDFANNILLKLKEKLVNNAYYKNK